MIHTCAANCHNWANSLMQIGAEQLIHLLDHLLEGFQGQKGLTVHGEVV